MNVIFSATVCRSHKSRGEKGMEGKGRIPGRTAVDRVRVSEEKSNCSNSKNIEPCKIQNEWIAGRSSLRSVAVIKHRVKATQELMRFI